MELKILVGRKAIAEHSDCDDSGIPRNVTAMIVDTENPDFSIVIRKDGSVCRFGLEENGEDPSELVPFLPGTVTL